MGDDAPELGFSASRAATGGTATDRRLAVVNPRPGRQIAHLPWANLDTSVGLDACSPEAGRQSPFTPSKSSGSDDRMNGGCGQICRRLAREQPFPFSQRRSHWRLKRAAGIGRR